MFMHTVIYLFAAASSLFVIISITYIQGSFCPTGASNHQPCPQGYYSNVTGVKRSSDCTRCPAGKYCAGTGKTNYTGLCDPGYYCRSGAYTSVSNKMLL